MQFYYYECFGLYKSFYKLEDSTLKLGNKEEIYIIQELSEETMQLFRKRRKKTYRFSKASYTLPIRIQYLRDLSTRPGDETVEEINKLFNTEPQVENTLNFEKLIYKEYGILLFIDDNKINNLFIFPGGIIGENPYKGELPDSLRFDHSRMEVVKQWGLPDSTYHNVFMNKDTQYDKYEKEKITILYRENERIHAILIQPPGR